MNDRNRILIVGAGPSGLTLATELTRRNIPCTVVDRAAGPAPIHESRALAFNARSQRILDACGVTDKIIGSGHRIDKVRICWYGNVRNEVELVSKAADASRSGIVVIRQGEIERYLIDYLQAAGVSVRWGVEYIDSVQSDSGITARLKTDSAIEEVSASWLAGCDGAHSQVRKQGGYSFVGQSDPQTWTLADATVSGIDVAHRLTADLRPGIAFATIPIEDSVVRLIHNGPDILDVHPMAEYCRDIHWESEFTVSYRMVKQYQRERTFLCGDAAHIHSPVGGRGMNLGIEDAATLAWLLSEGRESQYSGLRLPVAKKVLNLTRQQTSQMHSSSGLSSLAKKYGPLLLSIPAVGRSMTKSVSGLDTPEPQWLRGPNV